MKNKFQKTKIDPNKTILNIIGNLKETKSFTEISQTVPNLGSNFIYRRHLVGVDFPKNIHEIQAKFPKKCSLDRELYWYACILNLFSNQINKFIIMEKSYCENNLLGDFDQAILVLDEIEKEFGLSVWLIENKIGLINHYKGLAEQKKYVQTIMDNPKSSQQLRFYAYTFSLRAEQNVSCKRYEETVNQQIENVKIDYQNYLLFKLNLFGGHEIDRSYSSILSLDSSFPIIDRYMTFVRLCQLITSDNSSKHKQDVERALNAFTNNINDPRLINVYQIYKLNFTYDSQGFKEVLSIMDLYLFGDYLGCIEKCELLLSSRSVIAFELIEIYVKSLIRANSATCVKTDSVVGIIINNLVEILKKTDRSTQASLELLKLTYVFSSHNWASQLYSFLYREFTNDNPGPNRRKFIRFGELNSQFIYNPRKLAYFEYSYKKEVVWSNLKVLFKNSSSIELHELLSSEFNNNVWKSLDCISMPESRRRCYMAYIYKNKGEFTEAIGVLKDLLHDTDIIVYQDALAALTRCYMQKGLLSDCVDLVTDAFLKRETIVAILPCKELMDLIESNFDSALISNISLPIFCHIYSKYFAVDKDIVKAEKCEDFLSFHNINRPSEISALSDQFNSDKLIYFLKYICVSQVLENSIVYDGTEDIEKERIAVCQQLVRLDSDNSDKYSNEIKEITQKLMLQKAIQEIEQSKIYVDVEGIKNSVAKNLSESFLRFSSLPEQVLKNILVIGFGEASIVVPDNERLALFKSIFIELRDNFVSSNIHGLDGYLSVRIRHGTLSGQLRSRIEIEKLITSRDSETDVYKANDYWKNRYSYMDDDIIEKLLSYLNCFSRDMDRLVDMLKNKWLQIRTENKNEEGLFDFRVKTNDLNQLYMSARECNNYEDFIDLGISKLWEITESNLTIIRKKISEDLKVQINGVFDCLLISIQNIEPNNQNGFHELIASVNNARTSMLYELDNIANWFTRSRESIIDDYNISLPLEIGLETIKNAYPNSPIITNLKVADDFKLEGKTLQSFVDVIFNLLDNIIKHSKTDKPPEVDITVTYDNGELNLIIKNQINECINVENENEKVVQLKTSLHEMRFLDKVRREGGTGFYKINKILNFDLCCKNQLNFYYEDSYHFIVEIKIDAERMVRNEHSNN